MANAASCTLLLWFQMADDPLNLECKYTEKSGIIHMCLLYMLSPYAKNNRMFVFIGIQSAPNIYFFFIKFGRSIVNSFFSSGAWT